MIGFVRGITESWYTSNNAKYHAVDVRSLGDATRTRFSICGAKLYSSHGNADPQAQEFYPDGHSACKRCRAEHAKRRLVAPVSVDSVGGIVTPAVNPATIPNPDYVDPIEAMEADYRV
jgi:hypothetical protein